uniref:PatA-like N-terminal domain-containing protein n=1 Tax=uncultured bacterium Ak20-3 TaxID=798570 RepID=D9MX57_9BACT|nr:hypothetical protein AKSOIL_0326 [uncultured bacterium Ak20-3]
MISRHSVDVFKIRSSSMTNQLKVTREKDSLVISGMKNALLEENWSVASFKEDYLFARKNGLTNADTGGACFSSVDGFVDFLSGIHFRRWDGGILIDTGFGRKKLFFRDGELVFASSDLIDDRLGEVCYRRGIITLDALTESATKVTRSLKFGQVLVRSKLMTDFQLWNALKDQIRHIVKSLFMFDHIYFELDAKLRAPAEVVFTEGTLPLLEACYGYGSMYRSFADTIKPSSWIRLMNPERAEPGTFLGDLIGFMTKRITVEEFATQSKLQSTNIIAALMDLVNRGVCVVEDVKQRTFDERHPKLFGVRKFVKAYESALKLAIKAFEDEKRILPLNELRSLVDSFNVDMPVFFLDAVGNISAESLYSIYSQCAYIKGRSEYFEIRIKSMIEFLVQITGDHLSDIVGKQIRDSIRDYYS